MHPIYLLPKSAPAHAAVKVRSLPYKDGHGSGTYMVAYGRRVVVTAAHVVRSESVMAIDGRDGESVVGQGCFHDKENDLAFLVVPEMETRTAIRYRPQKKYDERIMGTPLLILGFPSHHDLTYHPRVRCFSRTADGCNQHVWVVWSHRALACLINMAALWGVVSGIDVGNHWCLGCGFPLNPSCGSPQ